MPFAPGMPSVGHELGRHAVAAAHLARVHQLGALLPGAHVEDRHAVVRALEQVAVAGHHQGPAARFRLPPRVGAEQVVRLQRLAGGHGPVERLEEVA